MKAIYISIHSKHLNKIIKKEKTFEFRNYIPKKNFNTLFVYETYPICNLKYIIKIKKIIKYPNKIKKQGIGNNKFNNGLGALYAYEIDTIYKLIKPLTLKKLKTEYNFAPPQRFAYENKYPILTKHLKDSLKEKI